MTSRSSFDALPRWVAESQDHGAENMVIVVAGTKSDLLNRKVAEKEAKEWAAAQGFLHFEVSAQSSQVSPSLVDLLPTLSHHLTFFSSLSRQNVKALFASLFARLLSCVPGIPQELTQEAVSEARAEAKGAWT